MKTTLSYDPNADPRHVNEGRFDNVDMGQKPIDQQILRFRRNLAQQLEDIIAEGILSPTVTLTEAIAILKS